MQLSTILSDTQLKTIIKEVINNTTIDIQGIYYNSQKCQTNGLFVAISGQTTDGKLYIPNAIQNGAKVIVCEDMADVTKVSGVVYVVVADARLALAYIVHSYYGHPASKLTVIGITGTNGKTTTAFLVRNILEQAGKPTGLIGTNGIYYGDKKVEATHTTPESLDLVAILADMLQSGIKYVVMEVSSHALLQHRVAGINFHIAAFTNLTHEHLDYHKTIADYAKAKQMLFTTLPEGSVAVLNGDSEYADYMQQGCQAKRTIVGTPQAALQADYVITNVAMQKGCSSFRLAVEMKTYNIDTQLTAYFNIQNAALSFAICHELGVAADTIITCLAQSKGVAGRLEVVVVRSGATAYVDYSHTPDALEKVLLQLRALLHTGLAEKHSAGRLICVFGCGGDRDKTKRPVMGEIANKYADIVCITDDNPRTESSQDIIDDILHGIVIDNKLDAGRLNVILNRSNAIKYAVDISCQDDIILVAGKGHETYQIIGKDKVYFSDVEALRNS